MIGKEKSQLALWVGMFVMLGLFARTFQSCNNLLAFQLMDIQGLKPAKKTIADSYGSFNLFNARSEN